MLDLLITLGLPFALFFPTEPNFVKENELNTFEDWCEFDDVQSNEQCDAQRLARKNVYRACRAYNYSMQGTALKNLTVIDFYDELKARWNGQNTVQAARLPQFEALDSRWKRDQMQDDGINSYLRALY